MEFRDLLMRSRRREKDGTGKIQDPAEVYGKHAPRFLGASFRDICFSSRSATVTNPAIARGVAPGTPNIRYSSASWIR